MSFFEKAKQAAQTALENTTKAAKEAAENAPSKAQETIEFIKQNIPKTIPLNVPETQLNQMVKKAITDDSRIKNLVLSCEENVLVVTASIEGVGLTFNIKTKLALEDCELSPTSKIITMRRLDQIELGGTGIASSLLAHVVKLVVCGLLGVDIGAFSLKNINGVTIEKELITADLIAMGATEAINNAINSKINLLLSNTPIDPKFKMLVTPLLPTLTQKLMQNITIENLKIAKNGITGVLKLGI